MGDVIEFKRKPLNVEVTLDDLDPQLLLECAIVEMWQQLGGTDAEDDSFTYHLWFLKFSDVCFSAMEKDLFTVSKDGVIGIDSDLVKMMKENINDLKRANTANDNAPDGSD